MTLVPFILALVACGEDPPECTHRDDCGEGLICQGQLCVPAPDAGCIPSGADDTCDAIDDDCDGTADEGWQGEQSCGVGACSATSTPATCLAGVETPCAPGDPAPTDTTCDAIDDDCDGMSDEDWRGEQTCGLGPCADTATPATCIDGAESPCMPGPPSAETCNQRDDDCDGIADEIFDLEHDIAHCGACGAACAITNAVPFCDAGTCRPARCDAGFSDCNADAADGCETEGPCPPDTTCDGIDDDVDGAIDEGFVPTTGCGVGLCGQLATPSSCVDGIPRPCQPAPEGIDDTCNGLDDDCDGSTDEGYVPHSCGEGVCVETSTPSRCEDGVEVACIPGERAGDEVCDGLADEDCDGAVDEGFDLSGDPRNCGRCGRICARPGAQGLCVDGDCVPGPCAEGFADCNGDTSDGCEIEGDCPADAACDGVDDDGDGRVDEGFAPALDCGLGACVEGAAPGACIDGALFPCRPGPPSEALDGICDGIDGDCDGRVDEGYAPDASCGIGGCAAGVVPSACVGGVEEACRPVVEAVDETCDGTDEDCDGAVDEGFGLGEPCAVGIGLCARAGRMVCEGGDAVCDAEPGDPVADVDCDGRDADCDGVADEGFVEVVPVGCVAGEQGACASEATPARCIDGIPTDCAPGEATDEVCDGIDNDCDGSLDEQTLRGFDPIYMPLAVDAVNVPRRSRDASLAWSGDALAVSWWEKSTDDADLPSWRAAFTLLDADGATRLASSRVLEDAPGRHPRMVWSADAFVAVWHRNAEPDGLYSTRIGLDGAQTGGVVEVAPGGSFPSLQSLVLGPAGPLVGWHLVRGGVEGREVRVDRIGPDAIAASTQITSNDVADRGPAIASFGDAVGAVWRQWPDGDERDATVWFRRLDGDGRLRSDPLEVGHLGGSGELPDPGVINDPRVSLVAFGRGFEVIWAAEVDGALELHSRRVSLDGQLDQRLRRHVRPGRLRSRTVPALWVPELQSTVIAWSEQFEGEARVFVGQLDPVSGNLTRAEPLPDSPGEQIRPTALAWLGDRLAVAYEETRGPDDWRLAVALGTVGCGRDRCRDVPGYGIDGTCDGIDDDCDGSTDEAHASVAACGIGACAGRAEAESSCVDGRSIPCRPGEPMPEECNGVDDDCDGVVDEPHILSASYFERGPEEWAVLDLDSGLPSQILPDRFAVEHVPQGGATGGFIRSFDPSDGFFQFTMARQLVRNRTEEVGGSLRFWWRTTHNDQEAPEQVVFYDGNDQWIRYIMPPNEVAEAVDRWRQFEVVLTPEHFTNAQGDAIDEEALLTILADLAGVIIAGETGQGLVETTDLDSVEWVAPPCP